MSEPPPRTIPALIAFIRARNPHIKGQNQLAIAMRLNAGKFSELFNDKRAPNVVEAQALADWSGYTLSDVFRMAGKLPGEPTDPGSSTDLVGVNVIPEVKRLIERIPPEAQRELILPIRIAVELREEPGGYDASPPPQEESE